MFLKNLSGWHFVFGETPSIVFKTEEYVGEVFYCEVLSCNNTINTSSLTFDAFVDGSLEWKLLPNKKRQFLDKISFEYIYNFSRLFHKTDPASVLDSLLGLLETFNPEYCIKASNVKIEENVEIGFYGKVQVPVLGYKIFATINSDDITVLMSICKFFERKNFHCSFYFQTISSKFYYKTKVEKSP